jgi:anaerobic magnesium-protoporphyrin IX monomethyl ester cyclase
MTPSDANRKRVLLINPCKQDGFSVNRIHMGLSLLGGILKDAGHEVMLMDFAFLRDLKRRIGVPEIEEILDEFRPDIIGISVFTYLYDECETLVGRISRHSDLPIFLGGPHFSVFPEDFQHDSRISYIVRGEAEKVILNLVETAKRENQPVHVDCPLPMAQEIPAINLDIAYGSEYLKVYQIQLSRGCPYHCSFCTIERIAGRRVRSRNIEACLHEIAKAKRCYPQLETIDITDDCPTFDKIRFKTFLRILAQANIGCELVIDNMRANLIDEEMLQLYVAAGGKNICLGAESGHPEVFRMVNKGESLDDIVQAARLIREYDLILGLCFVIGLPGDTLERHRKSIAFAKALKPDYVFWNMCIPWSGTGVYAWYLQYGHVEDVRNFSTLMDPHCCFRDPVAFSKDFPKNDRVKAWLMANLETHRYFRDPRDSWRIAILSLRHRVWKSFAIYLTRCLIPESAQRLAGKLLRLASAACKLISRGSAGTGHRSTAASETSGRSCGRVT